MRCIIIESVNCSVGAVDGVAHILSYFVLISFLNLGKKSACLSAEVQAFVQLKGIDKLSK